MSDIKNRIKKALASYAVNTYVKSGMSLGLGTGSTAFWAIKTLSQAMHEKRLENIKIVPTSYQTELELQKEGILYYSLNSTNFNCRLDLAIDGADELDTKTMALCKGGGAALFREKMVEYSSDSYLIFLTEDKLVDALGKSFPIPVEVSKHNYAICRKKILDLGFDKVELRLAVKKAGPLITENDNYILDCTLNEGIKNPKEMEEKIKLINGVIENGIFNKKIDCVLVGHKDGIRAL